MPIYMYFHVFNGIALFSVPFFGIFRLKDNFGLQPPFIVGAIIRALLKT